jgi:hypothetical protein
MGKKNKKHRPKKRITSPKQKAPESKKRSKYPEFTLIVGGVLVLTEAFFCIREKTTNTIPAATDLKGFCWLYQ